MANEGESKSTVLVAGGANLAIAVAKIVAGVFSGSSAMLAEGAMGRTHAGMVARARSVIVRSGAQPMPPRRS